MSATVAPALTQASDSNLYDPDEVLANSSPLLEPYRPALRPSPSPAPSLPSPASPPGPRNKRSDRRGWPGRTEGDAVLISHLDGHRRDTAAYAEIHSFTSDTDGTEDSDSIDCEAFPSGHRIAPAKDWVGLGGTIWKETGIHTMASDSRSQEDVGALDLKSLAADALAAVTDPQPPDAGPTPPVTDNDVVGATAQTARGPVALQTRREERTVPVAIPSPYSPGSLHSPREPGATPASLRMDLKSPMSTSSQGEGLPPIQLNSPRFDNNGRTLPSIRSQLGDIEQLVADTDRLRTSHHAFTGSPPAVVPPRLPSLGHLASPPIPPSEPYRDPLSPGHPHPGPMPSPGYYYPQANGLHRPADYASSSTETPGSDRSGPTLAAGVADRISIDGITIHTGMHVCKFPGCKAAPFQTQYLLNSHANVHSSARPHYCPVANCPRSEGGKGFKRKNEMIRHGLVHDSPGYVCPFCPDREHKYPRPDNLQRHVRVHHSDKDKDDPILREVLAQRPDGPNRGRRRRGGPS